MEAVLTARLKRGSGYFNTTPVKIYRKTVILMQYLLLHSVEEIAIFSARSKGGPTSHSCLLYLKNQEEYLININIILDDRREMQAKSPMLDQSGA